jgi:hypothetical protein
MTTTDTAMRDQDIISIVTISKSKPHFFTISLKGKGGTRDFRGMRAIRIIGITETIEIIIKIIIMKDMTRHYLITVIMRKMTATITIRKITTVVISQGRRGEEMIVINLQTNTTKIRELQIIACPLELSK